MKFITVNKSQIFPITTLLCLLLSIHSFGQGKTTYNVAIFLYDGVELLDFGGPGEVFGSTQGFNAYTVSLDGKEIKSQGYVTVKPEYSIKTAPTPDIVVYPGGAARQSALNPEVQEWVKSLHTNGATQMSVCTGIRILAEAGMLKGMNVTTWYGYTKRFEQEYSDSKIIENTRFVDNGNILTTAGVSAGIDGALHLVERIKGRDVAAATAKYMEYDKWNPEDGQIDYENELIKSLKQQLEQAEPKVLYASLESNNPVFFEGEMKNLGNELMQEGKWEQAAMVFKITVDSYPYSVSTYEQLSKAYDKLGEYAPIDESKFIELALAGKVDEAIAAFKKAREIYPGWVMFNERYLNYAGYQLLSEEKYDEAIKLFKLNTEVYPDSPNVFDSLGEAYLKSGNNKLALVNYQKALSIDPKMESAQKAVNELSSSTSQ